MLRSTKAAAPIQRTGPVLAILLAAVHVLASEPLPSDARVKTGKLANGVTWLYRQHSNPPERMALILHVKTGSLNETEEQRGLAHFIEHMAFNGSENFPPGKLVPYFESIGMEFGRDLNAFTGFDQTAYMLFLPDTSVEQMDKALMVLSDYAFRLSLLEEEVDKERGVILSEQRAGMSAQQRIRDQLFEKLFAGTRIGQRLPIGLERVVANAPRALLEDYYRTWYRPEHMTLIVVGDAAPDPFVPLIEKWFGQYRAGTEAKPQQRAEMKPFAAQRAVILSDPEYAQGEIDVYNISPARPATTTLELARLDLIERIGSWIIERRFSERIKSGAASFRSASAEVINFYKDAMLANASVTGEPKDWEKMLEELVVEVSRVREYGFLPGELALCKKELLSSAEDAVRKESTRNARGLLFRMLSKLNDGEPIMSAAQELEVLQKLLPGITLAEVSAAFTQHYRPETMAFVLTMPASDDVKLPAEEEVLATGRAALARKPDPPKDVKVAADLLPGEPAPGKLVESSSDEELGITSGWLANGVRVHHRFMDYKKDQVLVTITLAGGEIEETAENAGVTRAASLILSQPATSRLTSTDIEDIMTGRNITLRGSARDDTFTISLSGSPSDLEIGLQLAHALLTDGKLEKSALANWKQQALQRYLMSMKMPQFVAYDAWYRATSGDDPRRMVLPNPQQIEAQTLERTQAWFERLARQAPIEVAVVGEVALDTALPLVERYIGSLPQRPRAATHLDELRKLKRPAGPLERRLTVETITPQAWAVSGFIGCNITNVPDTRALNVAASILDSRLIKRIREELGIVYSIGAQHRPEAAYEDTGYFMSGAPCAPDKPDEVVLEIETIFTAFADSGPSAEELDNAKKQILNHLDTQLKEPSFWSERLAALDLHKEKLSDLKCIPQAYQAITAQQVQEVFKKYYIPARAFRTTVVPSAPEQVPEIKELKVESVPAGKR